MRRVKLFGVSVLLLLSLLLSLSSCGWISPHEKNSTGDENQSTSDPSHGEMPPESTLAEDPEKKIYWLKTAEDLIRWVHLGEYGLDPNGFAQELGASVTGGGFSYLGNLLKSRGIPLPLCQVPELCEYAYGIWGEDQSNDISIALYFQSGASRSYLTVDCDYEEGSTSEQAKNQPLEWIRSLHEIPEDAEAISFRMKDVTVPALSFMLQSHHGYATRNIVFFHDGVIFTVRGDFSIYEMQTLLQNATLDVTTDWSVWKYNPNYPGDLVGFSRGDQFSELKSIYRTQIENVLRNGEWVSDRIYSTEYFEVITTYGDVKLSYCPYYGVFLDSSDPMNPKYLCLTEYQRERINVMLTEVFSIPNLTW